MAESFDRTDPGDDSLPGRLARAFAALYARNRPYFGGGGPGYYGVGLEDVDPGGTELDLVVTFRAGEKYCCSQLGCHSHFRGAQPWSRLREEMDAQGLGEFPLPRIRKVRVVIEPGAVFDAGGRRFPPIESKGSIYEDGPFALVLGPDEE